MHLLKRSLLILTLLTLLGSIQELSAQQQSETRLIDQLNDKVKSEYFNLSTLIQAHGNFAFDKDAAPGNRGFTVPQARFKVSGKLDGGVSYNIHVDAARDNILLDAEIGYQFNEKATVVVGAQKPGISYEFMTAPHKIDFYRRTYAVVALTQNRDFGIRLKGDLSETLNYSIGMFNGNGLAINNDNSFYYAGRLAYSSVNKESGSIEAGINLSYGEQTNTPIAGGILPNIDGERLTYGGDIRYENNKLIFASEVLAANLDYTGFTESDTVYGFHLTGGYKVNEKGAALVRYEMFESDLLGAGIDQERILLGYKSQITSQTGFRINYLMPLDGAEFEDHGLVLTK